MDNIEIIKQNSSLDVTKDDIEQVVDYYPYGKVLKKGMPEDGERFLTTQHERDQSTGLDYRGARYYDADVARFLSLDPLASQFPSWSDYNYVMGNPVMLVDPDGRAPQDMYPSDQPHLFLATFNSELCQKKYGIKARNVFRSKRMEIKWTM